VPRRALPFLLFATLTGVFTYPLCGWIFRCGCASVWDGAPAVHCNIHLSGAFHCPWCEHLGLGALGFGLMIAGQALVFALVRRRGGSVRASTLWGVAALPVAALLAGGLTFLLTDYPHFLVHGARERIGLAPGPIGTRAPQAP
jgi:hypothetical protein